MTVQEKLVKRVAYLETENHALKNLIASNVTFLKSRLAEPNVYAFVEYVAALVDLYENSPLVKSISSNPTDMKT